MTIPTVFLTGGSGFVGRRLVDALRARGTPLILLDRSGAVERRLGARPGAGVEIVRADLLEPERYAAALSRARVVLHLAASTGKAAASEHHRSIARGSAVLFEQCRAAGVERVLFVSSIAAKFPDRSAYPYAQAKLEAEAALRAAGLHFTIVRPTMILGTGSPIFAALDRLAALPLIPIFGNGRTLVQPVHVDDVVEFLVALLEQDRFAGETIELGGGTVLSIEDLIQQIRCRKTGRRGRVVHVPAAPLVAALRVAERAGLGRLLPLTAGQLSTFRFRGTSESNPLHASRAAPLRGLAEMLNPLTAA